MILTVLGKYGPYAGRGGATSSYLVRGGGANVVLDFGSGALSRLQTYVSLKDLDGIVLSHLHNDHISDLFTLSHYLSNENQSVNLYLPLTECPQYDFLSGFDCFNLIPAFHLREIRIKGLTLQFSAMTHSIESYGVRVSDGATTLFYSGDTTFNDRIVSAANGADTLLLDCALPTAVAKGAPHMSVSEGAFIGRSLGARVLATHVHPKYSCAAEAKSTGNVELVEEMTDYNV